MTDARVHGIFLATDPGLRRTDNEDWCGTLDHVAHASSEGDHLCVITDGASGYGTGHEASQIAGAAVIESYQRAPSLPVRERLLQAVELANGAVWERRSALASGAQPRPFSATAIAAVATNERLWVAHAGACRAYLVRGGILSQLTRDHTWLNEQVDQGLMTADAARAFPWSETVTRALGEAAAIQADIVETELLPGDLVLLCSDGLWRHVSNEELLAVMLNGPAEQLPQQLIQLANEHGGRDNITVAVIPVTNTEFARAPSPVEPSAQLARPLQAEHLAHLRSIGERISQSLDLAVTLEAVMDTVVQATGGQNGQILLWDEGLQQLQLSMGRGDSVGSIARPEFSRRIVQQVFESGQPLLLDDAQASPTLDPNASVIIHNLRSVICAPLQARGHRIGVIYVENRIDANVFSQSDLDLLCAVADEAAIALEHARLYTQLQQQADELAVIRFNHENVLRSISSAIISLDNEGRVVLTNHGAERILDIKQEDATGRGLDELLPRSVRRTIQALAVQIQAGDDVPEKVQIEAELPQRGRVTLTVRGFPLYDAQSRSTGTLLIVDDITQERLLSEAWLHAATERDRMKAVFGRYLPASVVEQLSSNPEAIRLGGARRVVTTLFADIRGFTSFAERHSPEDVVRMLNAYLADAIDEVLEAGGMIDKILGDGLMAIFNAPLDQDDHVMAAARAALAMQTRLRALRGPSGEAIQLGVGISTGEAIVGNIGSADIMNYTAIGDVVNVAARLQGDARPGEILLSGPAYRAIADRIEAEELGSLHVKGRAEPVQVFKLLRMLEAQ